MSGRWVGFYWTSAFNVYLIKHHRVAALVISILVYSTLSSLFAQFFSPTVKHYLPGFKHYWSSLSCSFRISFSKRFMHHGATEIKFILSKFNKFLKLPITLFFLLLLFSFSTGILFILSWLNILIFLPISSGDYSWRYSSIITYFNRELKE